MADRRFFTFVLVDDEPEDRLVGYQTQLERYRESIDSVFAMLGLGKVPAPSVPPNSICVRPGGSEVDTRFYDAGSAFNYIRNWADPADVVVLDVQLNAFASLPDGGLNRKLQNELFTEIHYRLPQELRVHLDGETGIDAMEVKGGWFLWSEIARATMLGQIVPPKRVIVVSGSGKLDAESVAVHSFVTNSSLAEFFVKTDSPFATGDRFDVFRTTIIRRLMANEIEIEKLFGLRRDLSSATTLEEVQELVSRDLGNSWCFASLRPDIVQVKWKDLELWDNENSERFILILSRFVRFVDSLLESLSYGFRLFLMRRNCNAQDGSHTCIGRLAHPGCLPWIESRLDRRQLNTIRELLDGASVELTALADEHEFGQVAAWSLLPLKSQLARCEEAGDDWPAAIPDSATHRDRLRVSKWAKNWGKISGVVERLFLDDSEQNELNLQRIALSRGVNEGFEVIEDTTGFEDGDVKNLVTAMTPFIDARGDWEESIATIGLKRIADIVEAFLADLSNGDGSRFHAEKVVLHAYREDHFLSVLVGHDARHDRHKNRDLNRDYLENLMHEQAASQLNQGNLMTKIGRSNNWIFASLFMGDCGLDLHRLAGISPIDNVNVSSMISRHDLTAVLQLQFWVVTEREATAGIS